jgi:uncharacterized phage-like protein YoqJ
MKTIVITITGHRPNKLGGYSWDNPIANNVMLYFQKFIDWMLYIHDDEKDIQIIVNTGMALGVDQWCAEIALNMGCEVHAYIPCLGQESMWPDHSKKKYHEILSRVDKVIMVSNKPYDSTCMQNRNIAMVDALQNPDDVLFSVWDGTSGGTANCIKYALGKGKKAFRLNPKDWSLTETGK